MPAYAAPSRADDLRGLPPTPTFVGDLEPFRDEVLDRVRRLGDAGAPVRHRTDAGAVHGFDLIAPSAPISRHARAFLLDGVRRSVATLRAPQPRRPADGAERAPVG